MAKLRRAMQYGDTQKQAMTAPVARRMPPSGVGRTIPRTGRRRRTMQFAAGFAERFNGRITATGQRLHTQF